MGNVEIPAGLKELLQGYTVEVLHRGPPDLVEFAVQHFTRLLEGQRNDQRAKKRSAKSARKGVTFETKSNKPKKDDEEEEEEEEEDTVSEYYYIILCLFSASCSPKERFNFKKCHFVDVSNPKWCQNHTKDIEIVKFAMLY